MSRHFSLLRMFLCGGHDVPVTEVVVHTWWQHICLVERSTLLTLYLCRTPKTTFAAELVRLIHLHIYLLTRQNRGDLSNEIHVYT